MPRQSPASALETVADLFERLGDIPAHRIRLNPRPGTATERDLIRIHDRTDRLYELVDGVLVEKVMSFLESTLACDLIKWLGSFLDRFDLGFLAGPDGAVRLMPGLVRIPDVSFISWSQLPARERPTDPIAGLAPALAVEILSEGNTRREMQRKVREYFLAGVHLVWLVDPARRSVQVYTAPDQCVVLTEEQTLEGGQVLPGFRLPVRQIFAQVPRRSGRAGRKVRKSSPRRTDRGPGERA